MPHFCIAIDLPYDASRFSKNGAHIIRKVPGSKLGVGIKRSPDAIQTSEMISLEVRSALNRSRTTPNKCKTMLRVVVHKSTWQSDAINVVDLLADGVKKGLDVDDHWFEISVQFEMVKPGDERLSVVISQEEVADCWWCSSCREYLYKSELDSKGRCVACRKTK